MTDPMASGADIAVADASTALRAAVSDYVQLTKPRIVVMILVTTFATALIGAGGYGQPILTGIRLDDTGLILEGAVPAAVLAILVQASFDLCERFVVPKGLRL